MPNKHPPKMPRNIESSCNQAHGRGNKASKITSRTMLQRAPNTQHAARSTACCLDSLEPRDNLSAPLLTNSTLLLPTFESPLYVDFGLLRRTSSYFRDVDCDPCHSDLYTSPVTSWTRVPTDLLLFILFVLVLILASSFYFYFFHRF